MYCLCKLITVINVMVNVLLELQRPVNWLVITVKVNILLELLLPVIDYSNFIVNTMLKWLLPVNWLL